MTNQQNQQTLEQEPNSAAEQMRTPLLAALGAGNFATQAVMDTVTKAKQRVDQGTESARQSLGEFPTDFESLRGRLDPAELRKLLDEYTDAVWKVYHRLAESGEQTWDNVSEQPQVKRALQQLEEALATTQGRVEGVAGEARGRVDDVLGMVTKRTRSGGEQAAEAVQGVAADTAAKVEDLGDDVAHETRSASRKAANKAEAQTSAPVTKSSASGSGTSSSTSNSKSAGTSSSGGSSSKASSSGRSTSTSANSNNNSNNGSKKNNGSGEK